MNGSSGTFRLAIVGLAILAVYVGTFSFRRTSDAHLNSLQTQSIVRHGDIDLTRYGPLPGHSVPRNGKTYSIYGIGVSMVTLPVYAPLVHLGANERVLHGVVGTGFAAAAALAMLLVLIRVVPRPVAVGGAVLFAFGTTMWPVASTAFWAHGPAALLTALGILALLSERRGAPLWAGSALGAAAFVRPGMAVTAAVIGVSQLTRGKRAGLLYATEVALPVAGIFIQNRLLWGGWARTGYAETGETFGGPLIDGLAGELFSWRRGLFVYSPALALAVLGATAALLRRREPLARTVLGLSAASLATILAYATYVKWWGGHNQFGYRLLLDALPPLVVVAAYGVAAVPRYRFLALGLVAASVATMAAGSIPAPGAWDGVHLEAGLAPSPIARAWSALPERLGEWLGRLAAVAAATLVLVRALPDPQAAAGARATRRPAT